MRNVILSSLCCGAATRRRKLILLMQPVISLYNLHIHPHSRHAMAFLAVAHSRRLIMLCVHTASQRLIGNCLTSKSIVQKELEGFGAPPAPSVLLGVIF